MKNDTVLLSKEVNCDMCSNIAIIDGKTKFGPWAYMCKECYKKYGVGLGLGIGQTIQVIRK